MILVSMEYLGDTNFFLPIDINPTVAGRRGYFCVNPFSDRRVSVAVLFFERGPIEFLRDFSELRWLGISSIS